MQDFAVNRNKLRTATEEILYRVEEQVFIIAVQEMSIVDEIGITDDYYTRTIRHNNYFAIRFTYSYGLNEKAEAEWTFDV
ncbi:MAG: hypothetical protein ACFFH0_12605, partial [Promethearchaeota archaeon]